MAKYMIITAVLIIMALAPKLAKADGLVCTISHSGGALLITPGKASEFYGLLRNGMKEEAAEDVACLVPDGTKVIITDQGFASSTVRVLTGPKRGCVGDVPVEYYGASCH
jgi:ABC-type sugar transport system substrate-binding protein